MVDILLAAYNGEKYIAEQIDSILNQTFEDWFLYIKDDCSTDNTLDIILKYESQYSNKIRVIKSDEATGSAKDNFFSMFRYSTSDYMMTCDQDDVWLPNKIEVTYNKMKETAEKSNMDIPLLVHTDLKVVDENLNLISDSLFKMQNLNSGRDNINNLLVQNIVTGCTVMVNKKLLSHMNIIPEHAVMHDWWLALIASALGKIVFIEIPTVLYRQHKKNEVGAKNVNRLNYILKRLGNTKQIKKTILDTYIQTSELLDVLDSRINKSDYEMLNRYSSFLEYNKVKKIKLLKKYGLWKNSAVRVIGQILFC